MVHYRIHKQPPPVPIQRQINPVKTPLTLSSHLLLGLPDVYFPQVSLLRFCILLSSPHMCHMSCPSRFPWSHYLNNTWWTAQNTKLLINQHLRLVLPVCVLLETIWTYHVQSVHAVCTNCATPRIPTQSVDRVVGGTEVSRFLTSLICEWTEWFDSSREMGAM